MVNVTQRKCMHFAVDFLVLLRRRSRRRSLLLRRDVKWPLWRDYERESATGFGLWTALRYVNPVLTAVAVGCFQKCFVYVFLFAIAKSECQRQKGMAHRKNNKTQKQIERNLETIVEEEHSHKESTKYFRLTYTHTYTQTQAQRCTCAGPCCCYCCCFYCCCWPFCTRVSFKLKTHTHTTINKLLPFHFCLHTTCCCCFLFFFFVALCSPNFCLFRFYIERTATTGKLGIHSYFYSMLCYSILDIGVGGGSCGVFSSTLFFSPRWLFVMFWFVKR